MISFYDLPHYLKSKYVHSVAPGPFARRRPAEKMHIMGCGDDEIVHRFKEDDDVYTRASKDNVDVKLQIGLPTG